MELDGRAEVVRLSDAQASEAVLDPAKGLRLLCDAIERTMAKNRGRPRSAALLAASIDNMQSVRDLFGPSTIDPVFGGANTRVPARQRCRCAAGRGSSRYCPALLPFQWRICRLKRILALRSKPVTTPHGEIDVKLSLATVLFPDENLTPADVITRAQATLAYNQTRNGDELELTRSMRERVRSLRRA